MNSFTRFLISASMVIIIVLLCGCSVSGDIRFGTPAGKVKIKSENKKEHHEKDEDDDHHKKKEYKKKKDDD